jgi:hypothetical protein
MLDAFAIGVLAAVGSALAFGSFAVPIKCRTILAAKVGPKPGLNRVICDSVRSTSYLLVCHALQVDPFCYQVYKSFTCCITALLILTYTPFKFTYWGIVGGLIWVRYRCPQLGSRMHAPPQGGMTQTPPYMLAPPQGGMTRNLS